MRAVILAAAILSCAAPLGAQGTRAAIHGTVRDSATGAPVPGMTIGLDRRVVAVTRPDGTFRIDGVRLGAAHLEARRIGYRPVAVDLDIIAVDTVHLDIAAVPLPIPLEDIEIEAAESLARFGPLQGLMRRRRAGQGYSFLRPEIDEEKPLYVTDLLRTLPGVRVRYSTLGVAYVVVRGCSPTVYVNGIQMDSIAWNGGIDGLVHPDNVEAMEVHLGAYTPAEYRNYNACGVIAIWTR